MRPNTPHVVFTPEPAICLGGHFYATSTLRDTCIALMHLFVAGNIITNASLMADSRQLFVRLASLFEDKLVDVDNDDDDSDNDDDDDDEGMYLSPIFCFNLV